MNKNIIQIMLLTLIPFIGNPISAESRYKNWLGFEEDDPSLEKSQNISGKFIYDPITKKSYENKNSIFSKEKAFTIPTSELKGSFTIEVIVFFENDPKKNVSILSKLRGNEKYSKFSLGTTYLEKLKQTYYGGSFSINNQPEEKNVTVGYYNSIGRLQPPKDQNPGTLGWRHLAIVYDEENETLTFFLDAYLNNTFSVGKLSFDEGEILIGGEGQNSFTGLIDEIRISYKALATNEFLRVRNEPISNVSFTSDYEILPPNSGHYNLKTNFGAAGDGKTDDTAAIQKAFRELSDKIPLAYNTLYVPPGIYLVSDMLWHSRFFIIKGAGTDKTIFKLKDHCPGFDNPSNPKPVIRASSTRGNPGSNKAVNGSSIGLYGSDFTIDTGSGNPGAKGIEYHSNNHGSLRNIIIKSGDGKGVIGLDLTHKTVGPALIKNVHIHGFDYGIYLKYQEYSMTLENIILKNQNVAGIQNESNIIGIRKLESYNYVPAIIGKGGTNMIALLDSKLLSPNNNGETAIISEGALYARNIKTSGYKIAIEKKEARQKEQDKKKIIEWKESTLSGPDIDEYIGDMIYATRNSDKSALNLPIEDTPEPPQIPLDKWLNIQNFKDKVSDNDWSDAIQSAVDSGAPIIYFPWIRNGYKITKDISITKEIILFGMKTSISGTGTIKIECSEQNAKIFIQMLDIGSLLHSGKCDLILLDCTPTKYRNSQGCGKIFAENIMCKDWIAEHPQKAWVRQWNPESHEPGPCVVNNGGNMWILGFKTEYESSKLWADKGAKTEIFASFIYPIGKIPKDRPIFKNTNSDFVVQYGTSVYNANHHVHIIDTLNSNTITIDNNDLKWIGSRARMDLFISKKNNIKK